MNCFQIMLSASTCAAAVKVDYRYEFGRLATQSAPAPRHAGFTSFQHRCGLTWGLHSSASQPEPFLTQHTPSTPPNAH